MDRVVDIGPVIFASPITQNFHHFHLMTGSTRLFPSQLVRSSLFS